MEATTSTAPGTAPATESLGGGLQGVLDENYLDTPADGDEGGEVASDEGEQEGEGFYDQTGDVAAEAAASPFEKRIQELAKKYGLDPNNPGSRKALTDLAKTEKRMGDKDAHIQNLQHKLTPFELELQQQDAQAKPGNERTEEAQAGNQAAEVNQFPHWREADDAVLDFAKAITDGYEKGDMRKAGTVFKEMVRRELARYTPNLQGMMQAYIQKFEKDSLGDVLPAVRQTAAERASKENVEFAEKQLRTDPEFAADIDELRKPLSDKKLTVSGQQYPDNLMNRIITSKPYILKIDVQHPDPKTAEKLTYMERMRALRNEMASMRTSPKQVKTALKAGAEMAKRENGQERARQGINSSSSAGGSGKPSSGDFNAELTSWRKPGSRLSDYK